jgi:hypothetical protein
MAAVFTDLRRRDNGRRTPCRKMATEGSSFSERSTGSNDKGSPSVLRLAFRAGILL